MSGYRTEIDGLRAIAVLAVVMFHFSVPGFSGGFVGVDIFFVISGFLIGGILWREFAENERISLSRFYLRRLKRLMPAFAFMALGTSVAAYFVLLPFEFREFGKTLIASTVYLSNVLFFRQAGYFDASSDDKVLLHTWSLSVEEQFYIFLPMLMVLFVGRANFLKSILVLVCASSLLTNVFLTTTFPTASFYLFPFRAWELLVGVLLAVHGYQNKEEWKHGQIPSWIGLSLVCGSVFLIKEGGHFPGYQAISPTVGTCLILLSGRDRNLVNQMLSSRLAVFFGLISYSLYLWHWPIFSLSIYIRGEYSGLIEVLAWVALSIVLAVLSWRFVEKPFRHSTGFSNTSFFVGTVLISGCLLIVGAIAYTQNGLPDRFGPRTRQHIDATADFLQDWSRCVVKTEGPLKGMEVCPIGPEGTPKVLIWGDSHVRAFHAGLNLAAIEAERPAIVVWNAGCPPLFGIEKYESASTVQENKNCQTNVQRMRGAVTALETIDTILLVGRWAYYAEGQGIGNDVENSISIWPVGNADARNVDQQSVFNTAIDETVRELGLSFRSVFVLKQVPEIADYDSRKTAKKLAHGRFKGKADVKDLVTVSLPEALARTSLAHSEFEKLAQQKQIEFIDTWPYFCNEIVCSATKDGRVLYFDNNHVTNTTALDIRSIFRPVFLQVEK